MLSRQQLKSLYYTSQYEELYNECLQYGTVEYDRERMINGALFHFIGIVYLNDSWLFEFKNGVLTNVTLTGY